MNVLHVMLAMTAVYNIYGPNDVGVAASHGQRFCVGLHIKPLFCSVNLISINSFIYRFYLSVFTKADKSSMVLI